MIEEKIGKVIKGLGGLYEMRIASESDSYTLSCRAKGVLHRDEAKVLVGDDVRITIDTETPDGVVISEILERKNQLIRPPMANLDYIFTVFAAAKPEPVLETVDKLVAIAEYNSITPVIIITKADVAPDAAKELADIYKLSGITVFVTSSQDMSGISELSDFIRQNIAFGKTAAFAGASGVGKSTLINALFPELALKTAEISKKIERGRHTTRHVELFPLGEAEAAGYIADTPGFSLIDFSRFDFFGIESLVATFPDIAKYHGKCRYADCAHVGEGEAECAVAAACRDGLIAKTRLASYRSIYSVLKNKNKYE